MATILEELTLKLGIDQSQVEPELNKFREKSEGAFSHFVKRAEGARAKSEALRDSLGKINDTIPGVGSLIQAAFSPVVGILTAAAGGFAYFNDLLKEGDARISLWGNTAHLKFGDATASAREATRAVAELNQKFDEANAKESRARQEQANADNFDRGLKGGASSAQRARTRLDQYHAQALAGVDAAEKGGTMDKGTAQARRDLINSDFEITKRQNEIAAEKKNKAAHDRDKSDAEKLAKASDVVLPEVEARAADKHRATKISQSEKDAASYRQHIAEVDKALESAEAYRDDTKRIPLKDLRGLDGMEKAKGELFNLNANRENSQAYLKEQAHGGITGDQEVDSLQQQKAQLERALRKAEATHDKATEEQKKAEATAAQAREENAKLHADVRTHQLGSEDSQRRLDELGTVKEYPSLAKLAKTNPQARQLQDLQSRYATEDPKSIMGRQDVMAMDRLKETLGHQGLMPKGDQDLGPLLKCCRPDGTLAVDVGNLD